MSFSKFTLSIATLSLLFLAGCNKFERACMSDAGTMAMMDVAVCPTLAVQIAAVVEDPAVTERPLVLASGFAGGALAQFDFDAKDDKPVALIKQATTGNLIAVGTANIKYSATAQARMISAVRLNAATGAFDPSYSTFNNPNLDGRRAIRDPNGDAAVAGAVGLPDGSVWVGYTLTKTGAGANAADTVFAIAGISPDGSPGRSPIAFRAPDFTNYPAASTPFEIASTEVLKDIKLDSSGRPLLLGSTTVRGGTKVALRRLTVNWGRDFDFAPDTSVGGRQDTLGGFTVIEAEATASNAIPSAMAIDSTGRILIVGTSTLEHASHSNIFVIRLDANGVFDTTFNPPNLDMGLSLNDQGLAIAIQADGKILVGGTALSATGRTDLALIRLDPTSGALDSTFAPVTVGGATTGGKKRYSLPTAGEVHSLVLQGTKILALGQSVIGATTQQLLVRFNANGSIDTTFGNAGEMRFDNTVSGVAQPASGRAALWDGSSFFFTGEANRGTFTGFDFMVGKLN